MSSNVASMAGKSNFGGAVLGIKNTRIGTLQRSINVTLRKIFKDKTWASVAFLIGEDERTTKHRLAGTRAYNLANFVALLKQEIGFQILKAVMGPKKTWPAWFVVCVLAVREAKLMTDFAQHQLEMEEFKKLRAPEMAKLAEEA